MKFFQTVTMAVFFCAGSTETFPERFPETFAAAFSKFFPHRFSGADSAKAGKIRTALFYLPAPEHPMKFPSAAGLFLTSILLMTKLIHRFHSRL